MSRIVYFHNIGGPDVLRLENIEVPPPQSGEVRIKVKSLGLNRAEAMFRSGNYMYEPRFPSRIGYEAAGIIEAIGPEVTNFKIGDIVSVVPGPDQGKYGVYGEIATVPAKYVVKHPPILSYDEAAGIWMQYLTAYGALVDIANIKSGEFVIITAASSSVGLAAIQICNMIGAIPIATTRKRDKRSALLNAGAAHVIVTQEENIVKRTKDITKGVGARVAFDPVGGKAVLDIAEAMAPGGIIFEYGALSPEPTPFPLFPALVKSLTMRGYVLFEIISDDERFEKGKEFIINGILAKKLKPVIAKKFSLDKIVDAHRYMESNEQIGKIIVTV